MGLWVCFAGIKAWRGISLLYLIMGKEYTGYCGNIYQENAGRP
jgi:hypothetical protein